MIGANNHIHDKCVPQNGLCSGLPTAWRLSSQTKISSPLWTNRIGIHIATRQAAITIVSGTYYGRYWNHCVYPPFVQCLGSLHVGLLFDPPRKGSRRPLSDTLNLSCGFGRGSQRPAAFRPGKHVTGCNSASACDICLQALLKHLPNIKSAFAVCACVFVGAIPWLPAAQLHHCCNIGIQETITTQ